MDAFYALSLPEAVQMVAANFTRHLGNTQAHAIELAANDSHWPVTNVLFPAIAVPMYLLMVLWYTISPRPRAPKEAKFIPNAFNLFALFHNFALCVFSIATFYYTGPVLFNAISTKGYWWALCEGQQMWRNGPENTMFWYWLFYLSKYWEYFDTWIILEKGGKPSFLQVFHHAGAVICMWMLIVYESRVTWCFVVYNSFIHSVMYAYYCLSLLKFKVSFLRVIMTSMQLLQFIGGSIMSLSYFSMACINPGEAFTLAINLLYVFVLLILFSQFFYQNYIAPKPKSQKKTQ